AFEELLPAGGRILVDESQHGWTAAEAPLTASVHATGWVGAVDPWLRGAVVALAAAVALDALRRGTAAAPYGPHQPSDPETPPDSAHLPPREPARRPDRPSRSTK